MYEKIYFEKLVFFLSSSVIFSSLSKLVSLTDLNLSGNNIQLLPQMILSSMENLQVLCLHSNHLRAIPDLRRLKSLKVNLKLFFGFCL